MRPVIVFDGVCNLCNASVDFILRRDSNQRFLFASNQSEAGRKLLEAHGVDSSDVNTMYLIEASRLSERSTAALRIAKGLRFPWNLAAVFLILPRFLRDPLYNLVARNRYRLFGKRETCRLPTPEERSRFLTNAREIPEFEVPAISPDRR